MAEAPLLEWCDICCGYFDKPVLRNVSLTVARGESVVLLGPNGSGKSTLLRTACKLLTPLSGQVKLAGRDLSSLSYKEVARLVSVIPQEEPAPFAFSVREIVTMGRLAFGTGIFDTPDDRTAADEAMKRADCWELADRPINELSGGEKQRVLLARALAQDTPLVLMDEPTAHLDAPHQLLVASIVRELRAQGKAVVAAVHDLNLASLLAETGVVLSKGSVALAGPTEEVLTSQALDEAYGVDFERIRTAAGRLLVIPTAPAP